ncbi:glycosyltransferase [Methylobacterium sp. 190mf]|uniref:glycosyltransferase n=1 Tax=Methylobacterium sp. 190mf TaxID=1761798 RepID=UPI0015E42D8C|nr:glycosyltransferase [Methylobacterium sp. 190mf]
MRKFGHSFLRNLLHRIVLSRILEFLEDADLFDARWYLNQYIDVRGDEIDALRHYIEHGRLEGRSPTRKIWELNELASQTFDPAWYADQNGHTPEALENPTGHFVEHGFVAGSAPTRRVWELEKFAHQAFDGLWYAKRNPDVVAGGKDPFTHYVEYGFAEGRHTSQAAAEKAIFADFGKKNFDPSIYLSLNPDVLQAGYDPVQHFIEYGYFENRPARLIYNDRELLSEVGRDPVCWYYVGDTIDWLHHHSHLTGVGRVTSEILLSGLFEENSAFIPCIKDHTGTNVTRLIDGESISKIAQAIGYDIDDVSEADCYLSLGKLSVYRPAPGDSVVFAGVVWNASDALLFAALKQRGVTISVLVHDIIPVTHPELVSSAHARSFVHWLSVVSHTANVIFVSNAIVAQEISTWLLTTQLPSQISIKKIPFGTRTLYSRQPLSGKFSNLRGREFVLSVGTIDRRKNQRLLCESWLEFYDKGFGHNLPQLVLVGRDDEGLSSEPRFARLVDLGVLVFIATASDAEVAELYRTCLFTVFPSLSEGFGLPVAESIAYGKLCLSSDLAVIKAHAGDLAWYFDPRSRESLDAQLEKALFRPADRGVAEARIRSEFKPTSWAAAVRSIMEAADTLTDCGVSQSVGGYQSVYSQYQSEPPQVSFLVVNKNSASDVIQLIRWIVMNIEDVSYDIVIADNGSDAVNLKKLSFLAPLVHIVKIGCDRFAGEACNIAAELSRGRQLCMVSDVGALSSEGLLAALRVLQDGGAKAVCVSTTPVERVISNDGDPSAAYQLTTLDLSMLVASFANDPRRDGRCFDALFIDRDLFLQLLGFDLAFEPGPYEDVDLIARVLSHSVPVLALQNMGPIAAYADRGGIASEDKHYICDLNRKKFLDRWSSALNQRGDDRRSRSERVPSSLGSGRPTQPEWPVAVLHTPYPLTPGGGERYLLSIAALLSADHKVVLALPHRYSRLRLLKLAEELSLNLDSVEIRLLSELDRASPPSLFISMDNFVVPRQDPLGRKNFYICQFPFPMHGAVDATRRTRVAGYQKYVAYSVYARRHIETRLDSIQAPDIPVCLISPPVTQIGSSDKCPHSIMTVGRFFVGGHAKRHDLLIQAFKMLKERCAEPIEFHIVGSTIPETRHMDYVERLVAMSSGFPIHIHLNATPELLTSLYASTEVYWHGAGLEADLTNEPWAAEHFGISVVEAMSAGAIPFALASGGPREIIAHGVNGFLYDSLETLVESTRNLLSSSSTDRQALSRAAILRAKDFSPEVFARRIQALLAD